MSKARLIITAVVLEGRSQRSVARDYGVSEGWVSKLIARYRTDGGAAFEPRSRRPHTTPSTTPARTVALILELYNHHRPHRSLPHRATPAAIYNTRPKAGPDNHHPDAQFRVRHDRVNNGKVTLRINGELHHIGLGRPLDGTPIVALVHDLDIRIIHATTGEIIRTLTINPNHRYHGTGRPPGGPKGPRKSKHPGP